MKGGALLRPASLLPTTQAHQLFLQVLFWHAEQVLPQNGTVHCRPALSKSTSVRQTESLDRQAKLCSAYHQKPKKRVSVARKEAPWRWHRKQAMLASGCAASAKAVPSQLLNRVLTAPSASAQARALPALVEQLLSVGAWDADPDKRVLSCTVRLGSLGAQQLCMLIYIYCKMAQIKVV